MPSHKKDVRGVVRDLDDVAILTRERRHIQLTVFAWCVSMEMNLGSLVSTASVIRDARSSPDTGDALHGGANVTAGAPRDGAE